ncbi:MAG: hypothetical protein HYU52_02745 [Acidobacteria bacterium]|nr:hypothetical protein [Acidobacteriota bacterium]
MPSKPRVEPLDSFELDVPVTPADGAALWRIREERTMASKEHLEWCSWITCDAVSRAVDFHTEPFEL